jgi:hypothetical protein
MTYAYYKDASIVDADLAGSIANGKLANSSITIGGSAVQLGGSVTSISDLTGLEFASGDASLAASLGSDTLTVGSGAGTISIPGDLIVSGDFTISGDGSLVIAEELNVDKPTISCGLVNGAAPSSDLNLDLGLVMHYFSGSARKAFMGYDESAAKFNFLTAASVSNSLWTGTAATIVADLEGDVTGDVSGSSGTCTGLAGSATVLASARTIGGVSFNGSANIDLPGVNAAGSQNTSGVAATATILASARTIGGVSFNGSANIVPASITVADSTDTTCFVGLWESATGDLAPKSDAAVTYNAGTGALTAVSFVGALTGNASGSSGSCTGLAATATALASARTIGGVSFDGQANINLPGVNVGGTQDTSGSAAKLASSSQDAIVISPFLSGGGGTGEARFLELGANGTHYVGFKAPDALAANVVWELPIADGSAGQVLKTAGDGALGWVSLTTGDITGVTAGTGLSGGGSSGSVTLNVAGLTVSELHADSLQLASESFADNDTSLMTSAAIADKIEAYGYSTTAGDITNVIAGAGLSGGATSGAATLAIDSSVATLTDAQTLTNKTLTEPTTSGAKHFVLAQAAAASQTFTSHYDYMVFTSLASSGIHTQTLAAAVAGDKGKVVVIKGPSTLTSSNKINITASAGETIDGVATITLDVPYASVSLLCVGADTWVIV